MIWLLAVLAWPAKIWREVASTMGRFRKWRHVGIEQTLD